MHLHLAAGLFGQLGRDMEGLELAFQQHRNLKLGVQLFAIGATTIGFSASAVAFDKGAGEHLA